MTSQSQWYFSRGGAQAGPVPMTNLRDMVVGGQLTHDDLVWSEGMPSWLPIRQVPVLQAMFASAPASPPPASPLDALPGGQAQQQYAAPGYGMQYAAPNYGYQQQRSSSNGLAVAALVCSFLFPLIGLILSIVALSQMKSSGNNEGKGMATAGLIISICWFGLICLVFAIAGIAASQH